MSLKEILDQYKDSECYGPFCSPVSCGLHSKCQHNKSDSHFWYPDKIKDIHLEHQQKRGMKTCDILAYTEQGIYFVEFKPVHGTTDVHDKIKGTHKLLSIIYHEFNVTDLQKIKGFLVSCDNGKDPNKHFKAALSFLTQKNISSSLYDNGSVTIDGYKIPISYHRTCTDFINEGLEHHFS